MSLFSRCFKASAPLTAQSGDKAGNHVIRASIRDGDNKKYVFVVAESESWKVAVGLQRLRKGSQVRAMSVGSLSTSELSRLMSLLGWTP